MFICDQCHADDCPKCEWRDKMLRSHGTCEGCSKVRNCADCHCDCKLKERA